MAPGTRLTVVLMLPVPLEAATLAPVETAAVQVSLAMPPERLLDRGARDRTRPLLPTTMV